ncbi:hypothetical protein LG299_13500 [Microbacterium lacus]|uniref:TolB family protein n=1 Tax=Microbacterium lacus TaxID=415217 RepID=UPI00384A8E4B
MTSHKRIGTVLLAVSALSLIACAGTPTPAASPTGESAVAHPEATLADTTAGPERIAFARADNPLTEDFMLWTSNIDGTELRPVGNQSGYFPDWSPDRTHLLFDYFDESGIDHVATIRPDGSGFTQLTRGDEFAYNEAPDYAPDGATIVFDRALVTEDEPGFTTTLWTMRADGSDPQPLIDTAEAGFDYEAEFSPDGAEIVFVRVDPTSGATAVAVVGADGTGVRVLTPFSLLVEHPRWSPDGSTVIYNVESRPALDLATNGIWTVPASGGTPARLLATDATLHPFKPDYSPDGTRVLFAGAVGGMGGGEELFVMNADGSGIQRLTTTDTYENYPVWD